jgi:hypothetical protein
MIVTILWPAIVAAILPMHLVHIIATLPLIAERLVSSTDHSQYQIAKYQARHFALPISANGNY